MTNQNQDIFDKIMMLPGLRVFNGIYKKYKSGLLYIFFGGCTTIIGIGTFYLFDQILGLNELVANIFSWFFAVAFAYVTNRTWVFRSEKKGKEIIGEVISFCGGRIATLVFEEAVLLIFVTLLHFNSMVIKVIAQIGVLILNYIISKFLIFKSKK